MEKIIRQYYKIGCVCFLFFLMGLPSLNQMIVYTPDSARYFVWANSLARFEGFKDDTNPEPSRYLVHAPLYSIILAPVELLFPRSVVAAKVVTLVIGFTCIFAFYLWIKKRAGEMSALLAAIFLAMNPLMIFYSTQILSDIPFAFVLILFFMLAEKTIKENNLSKRTAYSFIAVIGAGVFMRDVGLTLLITACVLLLGNKQYRKAALICIIPFLLYLAWFVRNEIIIAGFENPSLRNSHVFLMHFYTSNQDSLFSEYTLRLWNNFIVYMRLVGKLLFMPDFSQHSFSLISSSEPFIDFLFRLFPIYQYILFAGTVTISGIGVWQEIKQRRSLTHISIFLCCYFIPILLYPINDIRFLFPLLILLIYFFAVGMIWLYGYGKRDQNKLVRIVCMALGIILSIPNIAWLQSYIRNSYQYKISPEQMYKQMKDEAGYPWQFSKPLFLAGNWIVQQTDTPFVVLCRWKELACWLNGNKIVETDPQTMPHIFDELLRDYSVKYIVSVISKVGLNEFDALMSRSQKYKFIPVYRIANVEVYRVSQPKDIISKNRTILLSDTSVHSLYCTALDIIEEHPTEAIHLLNRIPHKIGGYSDVSLAIGIAREFEGKLDYRCHGVSTIQIYAASRCFFTVVFISLIYYFSNQESFIGTNSGISVPNISKHCSKLLGTGISERSDEDVVQVT